MYISPSILNNSNFILMTLSCPDEESGLNIKWLSMQKHVCVRFREMAVHKQMQIEAAQTPQNEESYSFSM
jgi:hypothetical protein